MADDSSAPMSGARPQAEQPASATSGKRAARNRTGGWRAREARIEQARVEGRCMAKARTGGRCKKTPVIGRAVCRFHGGATPAGRGATAGRYGAVGLPARLLAAYRAGLENPAAVLNVEDGLALLDAMVQEQATRLADGDTPAFRRGLLALLGQMEAARSAGDATEMASAMTRLAAEIRRGAGQAAAEDALAVRVERLQHRIEEAWRIRLSRQQAVNAQDLVSMMAAMLGEIRQWGHAQRVPGAMVESLVNALEVLVTGGAQPMSTPVSGHLLIAGRSGGLN